MVLRGIVGVLMVSCGAGCASFEAVAETGKPGQANGNDSAIFGDAVATCEETFVLAGRPFGATCHTASEIADRWKKVSVTLVAYATALEMTASGTPSRDPLPIAVVPSGVGLDAVAIARSAANLISSGYRRALLASTVHDAGPHVQAVATAMHDATVLECDAIDRELLGHFSSAPTDSFS